MNEITWERKYSNVSVEIRSDMNTRDIFHESISYVVKLDGKQIYETESFRDRDLFIAELKARINPFNVDNDGLVSEKRYSEKILKLKKEFQREHELSKSCINVLEKNLKFYQQRCIELRAKADEKDTIIHNLKHNSVKGQIVSGENKLGLEWVESEEKGDHGTHWELAYDGVIIPGQCKSGGVNVQFKVPGIIE